MPRLKLARPALSVTLAAASLALAAPAAPAKRDEAAAVGGCAERAFSTVFAAFGDNALYTLAPDGDFEAGASGWTLHGASVADESSSIQLGAAVGAKALELPAGAAATTPPICVERGFPAFRFATRGRGVLRVQVLYAGGRSKKTGRIRGRGDWRVTRKLSLAQGRFHVEQGGSADVRLRFTASRGTIRIDDVYVDPRLRR